LKTFVTSIEEAPEAGPLKSKRLCVSVPGDGGGL